MSTSLTCRPRSGLRRRPLLVPGPGVRMTGLCGAMWTGPPPTSLHRGQGRQTWTHGGGLSPERLVLFPSPAPGPRTAATRHPRPGPDVLLPGAGNQMSCFVNIWARRPPRGVRALARHSVTREGRPGSLGEQLGPAMGPRTSPATARSLRTTRPHRPTQHAQWGHPDEGRRRRGHTQCHGP